MRLNTACALFLGLCCLLTSSAHAAFGGKPPLGPQDSMRRLFAPYDLAKLNYLGMNYCENLLDMRTNVLSYTHQSSDQPNADFFHLQYPDDMGRLMEALAWEADFSPVVRLEFQRRMTKGMMLAQIPGTKAYHFFRYKAWGKTYLILDDEGADKTGRVTLTNFQDMIEGFTKIGFRSDKKGKWQEIEDFKYTDEIPGAGNPGIARSKENWSLSPYIFNRRYNSDKSTVNFSGRYWLSREDKPIEYAYSTEDADRLQIIVGEPGKPMPILQNAQIPGVIHLSDRKTTFSSDKTGDKVFENPRFNYMILRKPTAWGTWGYSTALLLMWEGRPEKVEALAENGYGQIRVIYGRKNGKCEGKVWLYPFTWVNPNDMHYVYRNAESFLKTGKLIQNGYPTVDFVNAAQTGLAASAYMLTKYNDPMAPTVRIRAQNAVDEIFDGMKNDMRMIRVYFPARAAAWLIKTGKLLGDRQMVAKYTALLDIAMKDMFSAWHQYDGSALSNGWEHFHLVKAAWLAYDATSNEEYRQAWERSLKVYTIDEKGIYRYGVKMDAPGGFDTYFGSMPLGVWGHAGMMDNVDKLINLDVPAGWQAGQTPVKDLFHDTGNGPWSQDDADPEYVGLSLGGAKIPQDKKYVIPVGSFPIYDLSGKVDLTYEPMLENPFFLPGDDKVMVISGDKPKIAHNQQTLTIIPANEEEDKYLLNQGGTIESNKRICKGAESVTYRFDTRGVRGAGLDARIMGEGFKFEVSPDGKRWYKRLDTWDDKMGDQSLDLSVFTGSSDELLKTVEINSENDSKYLISNKKSAVKHGYCRYIDKDGELIYKFPLPDMPECRFEIMAGNGYRIQSSPDGKKWHDGIDASQTNGGTDAAWIRMLDVNKIITPSQMIYLRLTDLGDKSAFDGKGAFIQKIAMYSVLDSGTVYLRISNTDKKNSFTLEKLTFRTWKD
ncbi:MAG: hypothetical protein ACYC0V_19300 [Armatimonadota bacterium]